jgi:lipopolysaccharide export system permease protein
MSGMTRYVLRQLATATLFVTLALAGVVWLSQSLRFIDLIINRGLSVVTFLHLTLLLLPSFLSVILPVALFCAVVFIYHRLTTDSELVVLRAAGLSEFDLARPALILGAIMMLICFGITLYFMPLGFREFKDRQFVIRSDYSHILLQEGNFTTLTDKLTVYVRARQSNGELLGILVHDNRDPEAPVTMMAERGALVSSADGPRFILINGNRQELKRDGRKLSLLYFDRYSFDLSDVGANEGPRWREPRERYMHELFGPPQSEGDVVYWRQLHAEGHQRLAAPLYVIVFTLIGLAAMLAGDFNRRGRLSRMLFGIGAAIVFQGLALTLANQIVKAPWLSSALYAYIGVWAAAALYVLFRRRRHRPATALGVAPADA